MTKLRINDFLSKFKANKKNIKIISDNFFYEGNKYIHIDDFLKSLNLFRIEYESNLNDVIDEHQRLIETTEIKTLIKQYDSEINQYFGVGEIIYNYSLNINNESLCKQLSTLNIDMEHDYLITKQVDLNNYINYSRIIDDKIYNQPLLDELDRIFSAQKYYDVVFYGMAPNNFWYNKQTGKCECLDFKGFMINIPEIAKKIIHIPSENKFRLLQPIYLNSGKNDTILNFLNKYNIFQNPIEKYYNKRDVMESILL